MIESGKEKHSKDTEKINTIFLFIYRNIIEHTGEET